MTDTTVKYANRDIHLQATTKVYIFEHLHTVDKSKIKTRHKIGREKYTSLRHSDRYGNCVAATPAVLQTMS